MTMRGKGKKRNKNEGKSKIGEDRAVWNLEYGKGKGMRMRAMGKRRVRG